MKLSKVAKGIARGDVSNEAVRNILTEISSRVYGKIIEEDILQSMAFFDNKCPYTGRELTDIHETAVDHIVPQNREQCGLNIKGNLVVVDREANSRKKSMSVEDFLLHDNKVLKGVSKEERLARLAKIKEFQRKSGYKPDEIRQKLGPYLREIYDEIGTQQGKRIEKALAIAGFSLPTPLGARRNKSGKIDTRLLFNPEDEEAFKKQLLIKKCARFDLKYESGVSKSFPWNAASFEVNSSLRANIQSRPWWRTRDQDGLVEVTVSIQ